MGYYANFLASKEFRLLIGLLLSGYLTIFGTKLIAKPPENSSIIKINLFIGSFEINSPSAGLILCFLGFILIILLCCL